MIVKRYHILDGNKKGSTWGALVVYLSCELKWCLVARQNCYADLAMSPRYFSISWSLVSVCSGSTRIQSTGQTSTHCEVS